MGKSMCMCMAILAIGSVSLIEPDISSNVQSYRTELLFKFWRSYVPMSKLGFERSKQVPFKTIKLSSEILSNVVDVSYGGENGFNQAIELSSEILSNVKFIQEKRLFGKYFDEISQDTGNYVFGVEDTLKALEMGAVETLIVWENLDINRYVLKHCTTGVIIIKHLNKEQEADQSNFRDPATSADLEVQEKMSLLEWFANEYKRFGCTLEFVTNKSQEGSQFCRGFGGIGGILRYQLDMRCFDELSDDGEVHEDSD